LRKNFNKKSAGHRNISASRNDKNGGDYHRRTALLSEGVQTSRPIMKLTRVQNLIILAVQQL
jgi:hypothetical protein